MGFPFNQNDYNGSAIRLFLYLLS